MESSKLKTCKSVCKILKFIPMILFIKFKFIKIFKAKKNPRMEGNITHVLDEHERNFPNLSASINNLKLLYQKKYCLNPYFLSF